VTAAVEVPLVTGDVASVEPPSRKRTLPETCPLPAVTFALSVTGVPAATLLDEAVRDVVVDAPAGACTVSTVGLETLPMKAPFGLEYAAVSEWVPAGRLTTVVKFPPVTGDVASVAPPSRKLMIPLACPLAAVTFAVSVTGVPSGTLVEETVRDVVVETWHAGESKSGRAGLVSAMKRGIGRVSLAAAPAPAVNVAGAGAYEGFTVAEPAAVPACTHTTKSKSST